MAIANNGLTTLRWRYGAIALTTLSLLGSLPSKAIAQSAITPDTTLGSESSVVIENFNGLPIEAIQGGAERGRNLFHSFQQFNISAGRGAYFFTINPEISNIIARVTGSSRSEILGTLGIASNQPINLFFINPNGILFGPNASLEVSGSFLATTASALAFPDGAVFSATDPASSNLLTVDPSALFFDAVANQGIINTSRATQTVLGTPTFGLRAGLGRSLLLVGGDISLSNGQIGMLGGRIELAGLSGAGQIGLTFDPTQISLVMPENTPRSDIRLEQQSRIDVDEAPIPGVSFQPRRGIQLSGDDVLLTQQSGIFSTAGLQKGSTASIDARTLTIEDGSQIATFATSQGEAGDIQISILESTRLLNGGIIGTVAANLTPGVTTPANSGNITLETRNLFIQGSPQGAAGISNFTFLGQGGSGDLTIDANTITLSRASLGAISFGSGQGGNINIINAQSLILQDGSLISSSSLNPLNSSLNSVNSPFITPEIVALVPLLIASLSPEERARLGQGAAGPIQINAANLVRLSDGSLISTESSGAGRAGELTLTSGQLVLEDGAQIRTLTSGTGSGGAITINTISIDLAGSSPDFTRSSGIVSESSEATSGDAGPIDIRANRISLRDGGFITSSTFGAGAGGRLRIREPEGSTAPSSMLITGNWTNSAGQEFASGLFSSTSGSGNAGSIQVLTDQLQVREGGVISTVTAGAGLGGAITIDADTIDVAGTSSSSTRSSEIVSGSSGATSGDAGPIDIRANRISLRDGGFITSSTFGAGAGGRLRIREPEGSTAPSSMLITGTWTNSAGQEFASGLFSTTSGSGNAGNLRLSTGRLVIRNGAVISSATAGGGSAGNIRVRVSGSILLEGLSDSSVNSSGITSQSNLLTGQAGRAGNIRLRGENLTVRGGAVVSASTFGNGQGGNISIQIRDLTLLQGFQAQNGQTVGGLFAATAGSGNAGNLTLRTNRLFMQGGVSISNSTSGRGDAGDIVIRATDQANLRGSSAILANVQPGSQGNAGNIGFHTGSLRLARGAQISAGVLRRSGTSQGGQGRGGSILVNADEIDISGTNFNGFSSGILTLSERGARGRAGDITINTNRLQIADGGIVVASIFNNGRGVRDGGGEIEVNADILELLTGGQIVTETRSDRPAGSIRLNVSDQLTIAGRDPNRTQRRAAVQRYLQQPSITDRASDVIVNVGRRSGVFASARNPASGDAGSILRGSGGEIEITATRLDLRDRGQISASSSGLGTAGSVRISTGDRLRMRDSDITTQAPNSAGGDIVINGDRASNSVTLLEGDSDITTNSRGDGGNITIGGAGVVAFDDSDIISRSNDRRGGNITLSPFFSEPTPPGSADDFDGNDQVDLNASGQTAPGSIITPDTSNIQNSLTPLTDASVNENQLLANSCVVRDRQSGRFVITGADGLPQRPGNASFPAFPTGDVQPLPETTEPQSWRPGDPVVEPQGVYELADGRLVLSRECGA